MSIDFNSLISLSVFGKNVKNIYINGNKIKLPEPIITEPLQFTAVEPNVKISFSKAGSWPEAYNYLEYSTDGETWNQYTGQEMTLAAEGDTIYFNTPDGITNHTWDGFKFVNSTSAKFSASGSIMSLACKYGKTRTIPQEDYYFYGLFKNCTSLIQAPVLPATNLANCCYDGMFSGCTQLQTVPVLNAKNIKTQCYMNMFNGCTSLTAIPALPAVQLVDLCYVAMFQNCTSLKIYEQPKEGRTEWMIPAEAITADSWNANMFSNTGGDFTGNPVPGVKYYIGEGLQDKKLVLKSVDGVECNFDPNDDMIARRLTYKNIDGVIQQPYSSNPEISGTNSVAEVYDSGELSSVGAYSFKDCSNLSSVYLKGATEIRHNAFYKCTGLKTVDIPEVSALITIDSSGVFYDCYNLSSINCPKLKRADNGSFNGCKSLISIDIPEVQKLDTYIFQYCVNLSSVNIPNATRLETYCFMNCSSLVSLEIPKVNYIAGFNYCPSLSVLDFSEKTDDMIPTLNNANLIRNEINPDFRIIIPERLYDNWISAN